LHVDNGGNLECRTRRLFVLKLGRARIGLGQESFVDAITRAILETGLHLLRADIPLVEDLMPVALWQPVVEAKVPLPVALCLLHHHRHLAGRG